MDNVEDLDIVMAEYSYKYSMTSGRLWNYYGDKVYNVKDNVSDGKSFKYMTKITGKPEGRLAEDRNAADANQSPPVLLLTLNIEATILLKYLSILWRSIDLPLINCEAEPNLMWTKDQTQPKNNNLDCMIDLTFRNINRLFVISFENCDNDPINNYSFNCYMPLVEIKDFNGLINNKPFFDHPLKASKSK